MDSAAMLPPLDLNADGDHQNRVMVFDSLLLGKQPDIPKEFVWSSGQNSINSQGELNEPLVDLEGFLKGDEEATAHAAELIRAACSSHGFFQVSNHGVDAGLIRAAHDGIDAFFKLPIDHKLRVQRKKGEMWGYSAAHTDRFSIELPWKETFSFGYQFGDCMNSKRSAVVDYFVSLLGQDFEQTGWIYQKYCEAMKEVSLAIFELLAISLGVGRLHYKKFFEDGSSIMRCNNYPPCKEPGLTFGTGPHCDPTSLTILHQDQVGGLQVFSNNKWQAVRPQPDALVINLGDTFMALSNGRYKSCLHRAVVNEERERKTLVFFVSPKEDKIVRPPEDLVGRGEQGTRRYPDFEWRPPEDLVGREQGTRRYPDFEWSDLLAFTQLHYRADVNTLQSFFHWLSSSRKKASSILAPFACMNPVLEEGREEE